MSEQAPTKAMFRAISEPGFNVPVRWRIQRRTLFGWKNLGSDVLISEDEAQKSVDALQATRHLIYPRSSS